MIERDIAFAVGGTFFQVSHKKNCKVGEYGKYYFNWTGLTWSGKKIGFDGGMI